MKARILTVVCGLWAVGCSQSTVISTPEADVTYDGLQRLGKSTIQNVWIKTDVDLASYSRYMLDVDLEFRVPRDDDGRSRVREFPLSEADRESLTAITEMTIRDELLKSRYFSESKEPAPDVAHIHIRLMDIVALVPTEPGDRVGDNEELAGAAFGVVSSVGEATLVGEVFDSTSGEIIARFVERRAGKQAVGGVQSSRASGWAEIVPGLRHWGAIVRDDMDAVHDL
jgi:hypothetical protein